MAEKMSDWPPNGILFFLVFLQFIYILRLLCNLAVRPLSQHQDLTNQVASKQGLLIWDHGLIKFATLDDTPGHGLIRRGALS